MLTTFYPPYNFGGDGIFVQRLSNELARRGHQVEVIHCRDAYFAAGGQRPEPGEHNHPNITVHGLKSSFGSLSPLATQQTGLAFFKTAAMVRVLSQGFDVIHYHNVSLLGAGALAYGQAIKLYTMHEYWLICPTHVLFKFNRAACTEPHCFLCSLIHKRPPQWWRRGGLLEKAAKHIDIFLAPSHFSAHKHKEMGFDYPTVHLPLFVPPDPEPFQVISKSADKPPSVPHFLFVGRLEKLKGVQTLIPIFQNYNGAELWIAGSGSYEWKLRNLAGSNARVRFLGKLSGDEMRQAYREALAVIVPSLCYETFGQVVVEAFSQRTPALVRNVGALPEIIDESGGGLTYNTDAELVAAMDALATNPALRQELAERGYQAYLRQWTPEVHLDRYLALVNKLRMAKEARATNSQN